MSMEGEAPQDRWVQAFQDTAVTMMGELTHSPSNFCAAPGPEEEPYSRGGFRIVSTRISEPWVLYFCLLRAHVAKTACHTRSPFSTMN